MIKIKREDIFILIITILLVVIALLVIKKFIVPLIFTFILAYILNPLYKKTLKIFKSKSLTSLIFSLILLLLIILPIFFLTLNLTKELNSIDSTKVKTSLNLLSQTIDQKYKMKINFSNQYNLFLEKIKIFVENFFINIPFYLFEIFIIVFFYYYFSKDYNYEIKLFKKIFDHSKFKFIKSELDKLIFGIIYGQILVRSIQSIIGTIGFFLLGINGAIIWGLLLFFAAFLPVIGTGLIWIPLIIMNIISKNYTTAIIILIIGIFISTIDNILLPYIISEKTNIGPILTLISILGGIDLFGLYGIVLGPFFVGILFILIEDIIKKMRISNPIIKRYIWSEEERKKFKKLKTDIAKDKFIELMNKKYIIET